MRPRTAVVAGAVALAAFQLVGSFGAADNQPDRAGMDAVAVALVLLGPVALLWRDRRPLLAAGVALAAADVYVGLVYAYGPIFASIVVALFFAVQTGEDRAATWTVAAAGYAGFCVAHVLDDRADTSVGHLVLVAGWLAVVLAVSEVVRSRREQATQRARARDDQQRLELAQDLHDVLAHNLSLINVQAGTALHLADAHDPNRAALAAIKDASRESLQELRTALDVLRRGESAPRAPAPRLVDLEQLGAGVRASGLDILLDIDVGGGAIPAATELVAYRIVQEALTNVTRHARASTAEVRVGRDREGITLEVVDDGAGASGPAAAGNGIAGMHERAASVGGRAEAGPGPDGRGFRVRAWLPVTGETT